MDDFYVWWYIPAETLASPRSTLPPERCMTSPILQVSLTVHAPAVQPITLQSFKSITERSFKKALMWEYDYKYVCTKLPEVMWFKYKWWLDGGGQIRVSSAVKRLLRCSLVGELNWKAELVHLRSNPHSWSWGVFHDRKNKIPDTNG